MKKFFDNCISLGWYCGVAASMSKVGVRDFSGPFDWYWSDFRSVVELIDREFEDFFVRENLVADSDTPKVFEDKKYGFRCFHDVKTDLDSDYAVIHERYRRRADRFLKALHQPTCLFRAVRNEGEIEYIAENTDYIESVVKRYNKDNRIVYLMNGDLPFEHYNVHGEYLCDAYGVRTLFDGNGDLLEFCRGLIPKERIERNKIHYSKLNSTCASEVYHAIGNGDISIVDKILGCLGISCSVAQKGLFLWGFGYHGKTLYRFLRENGISVNGVVDGKDNAAQEIRERGTEYFRPEQLAHDSRVFVSIADDETSAEIMELLRGMGCRCATYKNLFE